LIWFWVGSDKDSIERELYRRLGQELIWLGDTLGDVRATTS
jgi:hypothetical protein